MTTPTPESVAAALDRAAAAVTRAEHVPLPWARLLAACDGINWEVAPHHGAAEVHVSRPATQGQALALAQAFDAAGVRWSMSHCAGETTVSAQFIVGGDSDVTEIIAAWHAVFGEPGASPAESFVRAMDVAEATAQMHEARDKRREAEAGERDAVEVLDVFARQASQWEMSPPDTHVIRGSHGEPVTVGDLRAARAVVEAYRGRQR